MLPLNSRLQSAKQSHVIWSRQMRVNFPTRHFSSYQINIGYFWINFFGKFLCRIIFILHLHVFYFQILILKIFVVMAIVDSCVSVPTDIFSFSVFRNIKHVLSVCIKMHALNFRCFIYPLTKYIYYLT